MIYVSWVNHCTLSQPITANISSTECTEREQASTALAGISCILFTGIGLIITGSYQCIKDVTVSVYNKFRVLYISTSKKMLYLFCVDSSVLSFSRKYTKLCLGQETIFIHVKAPPSVSVSCVNSSDGVPTLLCTSERFYPADLTQTWLRDGKYINYLNTSLILPNTENLTYSHFNWNYRKNTDGSYSVTSYLHLSSDRAVFYCWVNHSTLTQPITVNISSTECTERRGDDTPAVVLSFTGIICGMMAGIGLILSGCYLCFRKRTYLRSRVEAAPLPESVSHSTLGTQRNHHPVSQVYSTLGNHQPVPEIYSTLGNHQPVPQIYSALGNHQPVPCRNNSNDSTFPSL
ncbi:hypothetical protein Q7C36_020052 [Tachysurus vachellii]|uniref:Ig-like domain-containing protein n=1 Tax=Tachysurus vachellii TaxID=175792 RepID=A0AA88LSX6_TACVA|nr:hypothetical protein Q7C36_020052 [Tachysurus vachellii]